MRNTAYFLSDSASKYNNARLERIQQDPESMKKLQRELADKITGHAPLDEIRILLATGAQVNEPVVQGLRPLHYAVYGNNLECVRLLLVRGADVSAVDDVGYSALHLCSEHGNIGLVDYLIDHNARVCFVDPTDTDEFPSGFKSEEPLRLSIKNGHYDCAELLLQHGADPNARYFLGSELTLLPPSELSFLRLLLKYGANANVYDRDGLTPLMKACRHRDGIEAAKALIDFGADVNGFALTRQDFRTPLHYAILSGNVKLIRYLIDHGAHVNMPPSYCKPGPLDLSVLRDQPEIVCMLLEEGADPNAVYTYIGTALHLACCSELVYQRKIIELLLLAGADPDLCPHFEEGTLKSPFVEYFRSRTQFDIAIVEMLLRFGAEVIMQSPLQHPNGMLRQLVKLADYDDIFDLLLDSCQKFNLAAVERLTLPIRQRMKLIEKASKPGSLLHLSRVACRSALKPLRPEKVDDLDVPVNLRFYLLYTR